MAHADGSIEWLDGGTRIAPNANFRYAEECVLEGVDIVGAVPHWFGICIRQRALLHLPRLVATTMLLLHNAGLRGRDTRSGWSMLSK